MIDIEQVNVIESQIGSAKLQLELLLNNSQLLISDWREMQTEIAKLKEELINCNNSWEPPTGIPTPSFGIVEKAPEYDPLNLLHYYVDNSIFSATDTNNSNGSPETPRKTIPYPLPEGSVVEIRGGPYSYYIHTNNYALGGDRLPIIGTGTPEKPIFIKGPNDGQKPIFSGTNRPIRTEGSYIILENLDIRRPIDIRPKGDLGGETHHISIRHCNISGFGTTGIHLGWPHGRDSHPEWRNPALLTDIVVFANRISDLGDWTQVGKSSDYAGVFPHLNTQRVWIVDNTICHIDGDGIQINTWGIYDDPAIHKPPTNIYIGGNTIYECQENVLDFKVCYDVIISQNDLYGIHDHSLSSDGTGIVVHEDSGTITFPYPERLWFLFNRVHDCDVGFRIQSSDNVYLIGNLIYDIISSYSLLNSAYSSGGAIQSWDNRKIYAVNNTIANCDFGILNAGSSGKIEIINNIISDLSENFFVQFSIPPYQLYISNSVVASKSSMINNLLYSKDHDIHIRWNKDYASLTDFQQGELKGDGCIDGDPLFVNSSLKDFHLQSSSNVIDGGTLSDVYEVFKNLYSLDICADFDKVIRPTGIKYDMGAFEKR